MIWSIKLFSRFSHIDKNVLFSLKEMTKSGQSLCSCSRIRARHIIQFCLFLFCDVPRVRKDLCTKCVEIWCQNRQHSIIFAVLDKVCCAIFPHRILSLMLPWQPPIMWCRCNTSHLRLSFKGWFCCHPKWRAAVLVCKWCSVVYAFPSSYLLTRRQPYEIVLLLPPILVCLCNAKWEGWRIFSLARGNYIVLPGNCLTKDMQLPFWSCREVTQEQQKHKRCLTYDMNPPCIVVDNPCIVVDNSWLRQSSSHQPTRFAFIVVVVFNILVALMSRDVICYLTWSGIRKPSPAEMTGVGCQFFLNGPLSLEMWTNFKQCMWHSRCEVFESGWRKQRCKLVWDTAASFLFHVNQMLRCPGSGLGFPSSPLTLFSCPVTTVTNLAKTLFIQTFCGVLNFWIVRLKAKRPHSFRGGTDPPPKTCTGCTPGVAFLPGIPLQWHPTVKEAKLLGVARWGTIWCPKLVRITLVAISCTKYQVRMLAGVWVPFQVCRWDPWGVRKGMPSDNAPVWRSPSMWIQKSRTWNKVFYLLSLNWASLAFWKGFQNLFWSITAWPWRLPK